MNYIYYRKLLGYMVLAIMVLSFYDVLLHSLFVIVHTLFEWLELGLEKLIEHLFHTTRKQSQLIVFYLFVATALIMLYRIWLLLPAWLAHSKELLLLRWRYYKNRLVIYLKQQPLIRKIKIALACVFGMSFVFFFAIN